MKRKIFAIVIATSLFALALTGCAGTTSVQPEKFAENTFKLSFSINDDNFIKVGVTPSNGKITFDGGVMLESINKPSTATPGSIEAE